MALIKLCPQCQTHNIPTAFECTFCGFDLTAEKAIQEESIQLNTVESPENEVTDSYKICPSCGEHNPVNARKCQKCGEDISDQIPESAEDRIEEGNFCLKSVDGKYSFMLECGETIVGREHKMKEYLSGKPYVSRVHCKFIVEGGLLFIDNLSSTNSTFVNNVRVSERMELSIGDEIGLGGNNANGIRQDGAAYFILEVDR